VVITYLIDSEKAIFPVHNEWKLIQIRNMVSTIKDEFLQFKCIYTTDKTAKYLQIFGNLFSIVTVVCADYGYSPTYRNSASILLHR
jgi:hypothetical protein